MKLAVPLLWTIICISAIYAARYPRCSVSKPCSDFCSSNQDESKQSSKYQYHEETCNAKWRDCAVSAEEVKPPPYYLLTTNGLPAGTLQVDLYTISMQNNDFADSSMKYTLHGLWPGSKDGQGPKNQPYGCLNGEEFDDRFLTEFSSLFQMYWPTNPKFGNTLPCFVLSEWMKHGTCAVIRGADGTAFRMSQELYYRTAIVLANEANVNKDLMQDWLLKTIGSETNWTEADVFIEVDCVQCAYFAASKWSGTTVDSVPRMPPECVTKCSACRPPNCQVAQLDSTVKLDTSNAPQPNSDHESRARSSRSFHLQPMLMVPKTIATSSRNDLKGGIWRSFGAEQLGSGKFEFAQEFTAEKYTSTTDSPHPQVCHSVVYHDDVARGNDLPIRVELHHCGGNKHSEDCLALRLPDIGGLEVAFFACNHSGSPGPYDFHVAMNTPMLGNFLMFRCQQSPATSACRFSAINLPSATEGSAHDAPCKNGVGGSCATAVHEDFEESVPGAPSDLLGSWRSLEVSQNYRPGLARWNFTLDGLATLEWPNHESRGIKRYTTTRSVNGTVVFLTDQASGNLKACIFEFKYNEVYSYAVLSCGADNGPVPRNSNDGLGSPNDQWAMGRCNGCDNDCFYSCNPQNDYCGNGSCKPKVAKSSSKAETWKLPNWCKPAEKSCWPTQADIAELEQQLDPHIPRNGLKWTSYPQPQTAPVPSQSLDDMPFYGLGSNDTQGVKALYHYENLDDLVKPCFTGPSSSAWNKVSDVCKAAVRQNEYHNWDPYIVVFPLHERHVAHALRFAVRHRLCIAVSGTGHEYLSRNSCPTGGIMIRTILLKEKTFLETWDEDPVAAPHGAFRFGAGATFSEMHEFSGRSNRLVVSGWCSTVGMVGYHLGGGHGPFSPSLGLGVDNVLSIEVMQIDYDSRGQPTISKKIASRRHNPQLFWAMRGGGGSVWGVVLSMTVRAHSIPEGGISHVFMQQNGTFCPGKGAPFGYEWLRRMWTEFAFWNLMLNEKVSTQPGFSIDTSNYTSGDLCSVKWKFNFEYFFAGSHSDPNYGRFRDKLKAILGVTVVSEAIFQNAFQYILSMEPAKFSLIVNNPLPNPSDQQTGSQNSVLVSRQAMRDEFPATMMEILDICVSTLRNPDPTSPDPKGYRCGFHYLYTALTGNQGSKQPDDTAISRGLRTSLMLWNTRTLTTDQMERTLHRIAHNTYFSESPYVMHQWTSHYWDADVYEQLLAVKKAHDPGNHFWCHHCVGDNPNDAYGRLSDRPAGISGSAVLDWPLMPLIASALALVGLYFAYKSFRSVSPPKPRGKRHQKEM